MSRFVEQSYAQASYFNSNSPSSLFNTHNHTQPLKVTGSFLPPLPVTFQLFIPQNLPAMISTTGTTELRVHSVFWLLLSVCSNNGFFQDGNLCVTEPARGTICQLHLSSYISERAARGSKAFAIAALRHSIPDTWVLE